MANTQTGNSLSIFALLDALRRRKLFVAVPAMLFTAAFAFYAFRQPDKYRATTLLVGPGFGTETTTREFIENLFF